MLNSAEVKIFYLSVNSPDLSSFLSAVKTRCGGFDLTAVDCSQLPETSDFCPNVVSSNRLLNDVAVQERSASFSESSSSYGNSRNIVDSGYGSAPKVAPATSYGADRIIADSGYGSAPKVAPVTSYGADRSFSGSTYGSGAVKVAPVTSYGADRNVGGSAYGTSIKAASTSSYGNDGNLGGSGYGNTVKAAPATSYAGSSYTNNVKSTGSSYGNGGNYDSSYSTQTYGEPFGIQSTGEYTYYKPEPLDLSRCGAGKICHRVEYSLSFYTY